MAVSETVRGWLELLAYVMVVVFVPSRIPVVGAGQFCEVD